MPQLKEATVAVTGQIMDIEPVYKYENNVRTATLDGYKVILAVGNGDGYASVKLSVDEFNAISPEFARRVGWIVRYGAWSRGAGSDAQATCRYVRLVNEDDVDKLVSVLPATASK